MPNSLSSLDSEIRSADRIQLRDCFHLGELVELQEVFPAWHMTT